MGRFDLAVSRFSGRKAPPHPGGMPGLPDRITREAYSHEVSSAGFWAGGAAAAEPFFYSYIYPEPDGYRAAKPRARPVRRDLGEFVLPYAEVRAASDPEAMLLGFFQSTYDAAADLAAMGPRRARARARRAIDMSRRPCSCPRLMRTWLALSHGADPKLRCPAGLQNLLCDRNLGSLRRRSLADASQRNWRSPT